jgi:hypothetical protein
MPLATQQQEQDAMGWCRSHDSELSENFARFLLLSLAISRMHSTGEHEKHATLVSTQHHAIVLHFFTLARSSEEFCGVKWHKRESSVPPCATLRCTYYEDSKRRFHQHHRLSSLAPVNIIHMFYVFLLPRLECSPPNARKTNE